MTQVAHGVGGGGTGRSGASLPLRIHELLLSLAGRLDDDALADARQMLASTELDRSLEFVAGCLVAGKVVLTGRQQQELESLYADTYLDVSLLDRVIARDRVDSGRHKFVTGPVAHREPDHGIAEAIRPVLDVLPDVRSVWCVWRVSPAGPASGPVPHRVVLIGVGPDGFAPATAYRVEDALRRAGVRASVEVLVDGVEPPEYHKEAMRCARQVPFAEAGQGGPASEVTPPAAQESWRDEPRSADEPSWRGEPAFTDEQPVRSTVADAPRVEVSRDNPPWMDAPRAEPFGDTAPSQPSPEPEQPRRLTMPEVFAEEQHTPAPEQGRRAKPEPEPFGEQQGRRAKPESFGEQSHSAEPSGEQQGRRAKPESFGDSPIAPPFADQSRSQLPPAPDPLAEQSRSQMMPAPFAEQSRSAPPPAPDSLAEQSRSQMMPAPDPLAEQSRSQMMPAPDPFAEQSRSAMMPAPDPRSEQHGRRAKPEPFAEQSRSQMAPAPDPLAEQSRSQMMPAPDPFAEQSRSQMAPAPEPFAEQSRSQMAPAPDPFAEQSRSQMAPAPDPLAEQSRSQMMPAPDPLAEQSRSRAMPPPEPLGEQSRSRAFPRQDPHAEQSRSRAMPPPERNSGFGADAPKLPSSPVEPPWRDAPKAEPTRSAPGEPVRGGDESDNERTIIEPLKAIDPQYRQESSAEPSEKPSPSPKPKPSPQPPSALNVDTPTGSAPSPKRQNPAPDDKRVDRHSAAFGDDMLNTQERNLLKELQDELARREQAGSQSGSWQIDKAGRHGKPASAGPFDQPTHMTRPVITNGKPRPDQRRGY